MDNLENLSRETILLKKLLSYFSEENKSEILINILKKKTSISLRILDWLVTNYSKKKNIIIEQIENNEISHFNIHSQYKNQLKAYSKTNFDPFCRKNRITIDITNPTKLKLVKDGTSINKNNSIETTVGQLNFFRWFIKNGLLNYLLFNAKDIEEDMNLVLTNNKNSDKKKRCCLSDNNCKQMVMINTKIKITF